MFSKRFVCANEQICDYDTPVPSPLLRKRFDLDCLPEKAVLTICGLGFYELFINGKRITRGALAPYISNPDDILYYDQYDLRDDLQVGENVLGIVLGNGFMNAFGGSVWDFEKAAWRGAPRVAFALELQSGDHSTVIEADETVKTAASPIFLDDLRIGAFYDANREIPRWNCPGFDDSDWQAARPIDSPRGEARICEAEPVVVYAEKPFTVTLDEAVEVMRAEKKSGKILTIGYQPRMSANYRMIKKIIDSGELGRVYYMQAGGGRRRGIPTPYGTTFIEKETGGVGAMGDIGTYSLDMLLNAVGYPKPLTVTGYTSAFFGTDPAYYPDHPEYAEKFGVEDFAAGFIRLENGIVLDFRIAWAMNMDSCGDSLILGTKGGLRIPSMPCYNGDLPQPMKIYKTVAGKEVSFEVPKESAPDLFYKKLRSFVDAVKNGGEATFPTSQILYNQAIIDGIIKSNELGREIQVEIPEI